MARSAAAAARSSSAPYTLANRSHHLFELAADLARLVLRGVDAEDVMPSIRSLAWESVSRRAFIGLSSGGFKGASIGAGLPTRAGQWKCAAIAGAVESGAGRGDRQGHRGGGERCDKSVMRMSVPFPTSPAARSTYGAAMRE